MRFRPAEASRTARLAERYVNTEGGFLERVNVKGGSGNDVIRGTSRTDFVDAGSGRDIVDAGDGDDRIYALPDGQPDTLRGGRGARATTCSSGRATPTRWQATAARTWSTDARAGTPWPATSRRRAREDDLIGSDCERSGQGNFGTFFFSSYTTLVQPSLSQDGDPVARRQIADFGWQQVLNP